MINGVPGLHACHACGNTVDTLDRNCDYITKRTTTSIKRQRVTINRDTDIRYFCNTECEASMRNMK